MEELFDLRLQELLQQAELDVDALTGLTERLRAFVRPYGDLLVGARQRRVHEYVSGLLSKLDKKTGEAIAYLHDQDRQGIQIFIGQDDWDHQPLADLLARQIGHDLGAADGVLVFDPSAFAKKGTKSVGVARQWCGRLGKIENCQVGVYLGYVTRKEHALVDGRLYLPAEWTGHRARCREAGVPPGTRFRTRHELALEMLDRHGSVLPHAWVTGDDEMGRPAHFREELRRRHERYLLAVPANTLIRDRQADAPVYGGRGRPAEPRFQRMDRWRAAQPETAWALIDVRDGEKGPLMVEALQRRVQTRTSNRLGAEETLFVTRERQADGAYKHDYYLSGEITGMSTAEFARVAKAEHRIEECLKRAKSEAGLGDSQARNWVGWHHHQILSLVAAWFLVRETRRGKNPHPRAHGAALARHDREPVGSATAQPFPAADRATQPALDATEPTRPLLSPSRA